MTRVATGTTVVGVLCGLAFAASASAAPIFGTPVDLSASGGDALFPQVAFDASGDALAIWVRFDGTNEIVQSSFRPAGGAFGAPVDLSAGGGNAISPHVAFDASGDALAVWVRGNGTNSIAQGAFRPAGGAFGAPVDLSAGGGDALFPQVAFDASGDALAVWSRNDGSNYLVQSSFRPAGGAFATPVTLSAPGQNTAGPQVAFDGSGNALAIWYLNTSNAGVQSAFRPAGGAFDAPINLSSTDNGRSPQVAFDASGDALAVWSGVSGGNSAVRSSFRPAGGAFATPLDLPVASPVAGSPHVAVDPSGDALVVWVNANGTNHIVQSSFRPAGGVFATPVDLSASGQNATGVPQVAFDAFGDALAVWLGSGGTNAIVQSAFRPAGGAFATPLDLTAASLTGSPQVEFDASGNAVVVWNRFDGSNQIVQAAFGTAPKQTLGVSISGSGSGTVTAPAINCPGTCSHAYPQGQKVALTATPATGSTFTGWSGGGCSGGAGCSVTMSADQAVSATFARASTPAGPLPAGPTPPGPTPPTPPAARPSNAFTILDEITGPHGTLLIDLNVPGPGVVDAIATHANPTNGFLSALAPGPGRFALLAGTVTATHAGHVHITLGRTRRFGKARFRYRRIHARVTIAYTPTGGIPASKANRIVIRA